MVTDPHYSIFTFKKLKIPVKSTLYLKQNLDITCQVYWDGKNSTVEYRGEVMEIRPAARMALEGIGKKIEHCDGLKRWTYGDETIRERRDRLRDEEKRV